MARRALDATWSSCRICREQAGSPAPNTRSDRTWTTDDRLGRRRDLVVQAATRCTLSRRADDCAHGVSAIVPPEHCFNHSCDTSSGAEWRLVAPVLRERNEGEAPLRGGLPHNTCS